MKREDIIAMAREAGGADIESNGYTSWVGTQTTEFLERFAALVAAAAKAEEHEACAKVCDDIDAEYEGEDVLATWCATAIRARGKTK